MREVKSNIVSFIYDKFGAYYLRIPLIKTVKGEDCPEDWYCQYFPKSEYTVRDVIEERLKVMLMLERTGRRQNVRTSRINAYKMSLEDHSELYRFYNC